jgi:hypothetical protein
MSAEAKARISAAQKQRWAKRRKPGTVSGGQHAQTRAKLGPSLKKAVLEFTKNRPLTKQEILTEIGKIGYTTKAKNSMTVLNPLLYGKNPKFKRNDGKFSPA